MSGDESAGGGHPLAVAEHIAATLTAAVDNADWKQVARIIREHWIVLTYSHWQLGREAVRALPDSYASADPVIRAAEAFFLELGTGHAEVPDVVPVGEEELDALGRSNHAFDVLVVGTTRIIIHRISGQYSAASELSERLRRIAAIAARGPQTASAKAALPYLRLQWAITKQLVGELDESTDEFRLAYRGGEGMGIDFLTRNTAGCLALNNIVAGDVHKALEWLKIEERYDNSSHWAEDRVRVSGRIARALVCLERADTAGARESLTELGEISDSEELWAFAAHAHCRLALLSDNAAEGIDRLARAISIHKLWYREETLGYQLLTDSAAELHCALGNGTAALAVAASAPPQLQRLVRARVALLAGDPSSALSEASTLLSSTGVSPRFTLDALMITISSAVATARHELASEYLSRALSLAELTGAIRPFLTLTQESLDWIAAAGLETELTVSGFDPTTGPRLFSERVTTVRLTQRELEVLRELASGRTMTMISVRMFVSMNTVKSQIRSVYRKLGVHSRAEAIETAVRLRLL
ncbi:LuxR C-terminal-related transcriptional regulator [Rhodococcus hoagii]|nr:LuxR C-terminal-related transcriptional regulator [Prescottella equi]